MRRMSKLFATLISFGTAAVVILSASPAFAQATDAARADRDKWLGLGAALEGIARNPQASNKIFVPMIVGLALIESLVIYGLLIAFQLYGKIG